MSILVVWRLCQHQPASGYLWTDPLQCRFSHPQNLKMQVINSKLHFQMMIKFQTNSHCMGHILIPQTQYLHSLYSEFHKCILEMHGSWYELKYHILENTNLFLNKFYCIHTHLKEKSLDIVVTRTGRQCMLVTNLQSIHIRHEWLSVRLQYLHC